MISNLTYSISPYKRDINISQRIHSAGIKYLKIPKNIKSRYGGKNILNMGKVVMATLSRAQYFVETVVINFAETHPT